MPDSEPLPSVDDLQFRRAQPMESAEPEAGKNCAACKQPIDGQHYQVQNHVICPSCAAKILAGKQAKKPIPWVRLVIYGGGAALAGCILYAIPLAMGFQIGIVALAVGWMVGKAIRAGGYGIGGRPQQILAVALTYFAISTSFIPALVFTGMKKGFTQRSAATKNPSAQPAAAPVPKPEKALSPGKAVAGLLVLATISPFLELASSPVGGLISLFIIFIGLQRAWALTAGHEILVTGPYS
jgi:DNA-directed RNA polymerase subunit RPC12/RpoP